MAPPRQGGAALQQSVPPVLRPVTVQAEPVSVAAPTPGLVLITPRGVRVEGLDHETLLLVLPRLG